MKIVIFKRGDLIIDKTRNLHGLIVKVERSTVTVKWANHKNNSRLGQREILLPTEYLRKQIMKGAYAHQEKNDKAPE